MDNLDDVNLRRSQTKGHCFKPKRQKPPADSRAQQKLQILSFISFHGGLIHLGFFFFAGVFFLQIDTDPGEHAPWEWTQNSDDMRS